MRAFGIAGYKNAGKTTLVVALVSELSGRGFRVGTLKHAHHDFDIDHPGKDSHRHRQAGAVEVVIAASRRVARIRELGDGGEPALDELLAGYTGVDLVLVEGHKGGALPKLEVRRAGVPALGAGVQGLVAIVGDAAVEGGPLPVLGRDDVPAIADFILARLGLPCAPA